MQIKKFFDTSEVQNYFNKASSELILIRNDEKLYRLGQVLRILVSKGPYFDNLCQVNIKWIGEHLCDAVRRLTPPYSDESIDNITSSVYRFLSEYDLSVSDELPGEIQHFMALTENRSSSMLDSARLQVEFAQQKMSVAILKNILNNEDFGSVRDMSTYSANVVSKIDEWDRHIKTNSEKAERLGALFEEQSTAFNFVGLHKGFADMESTILTELKWSRIGMSIFGALVLIPGIFDLYLTIGIHQDLQKISLYTLIAAGIGTLTITLLLLYFFRISLRKSDSCHAQLVQVRLRMSLCRFIQSYSDYAKEIKEKNPEALSKFEALIFSGIVGTTEKIPSTFDGIEQLTALAKSLREKS